MITLDKSKKLDHKTYLEYPSGFGTLIRQLMHNSNETNFKTFGPTTRKQNMPPELISTKISWYPNDPEYTTTLIGVCVSNYPTQYLKEKVLEYWIDDERAEKELQEILDSN